MSIVLRLAVLLVCALTSFAPAVASDASVKGLSFQNFRVDSDRMVKGRIVNELDVMRREVKVVVSTFAPGQTDPAWSATLAVGDLEPKGAFTVNEFYGRFAAAPERWSFAVSEVGGAVDAAADAAPKSQKNDCSSLFIKPEEILILGAGRCATPFFDLTPGRSSFRFERRDGGTLTAKLRDKESKDVVDLLAGNATRSVVEKSLTPAKPMTVFVEVDAVGEWTLTIRKSGADSTDAPAAGSSVRKFVIGK